ncbi:MAG: N-acetylmuramoyl-L-alanine amidase [Maricaulaceae bacterium]
MKFTSAPSPNFDKRTLPISMLVLHYTGMETGAMALERMRDPSAKVSAHYMVEEDGEIFRLVEDDKRAWHAGVSEWAGEANVNSASIGIEIVNGGHDYGLPDFPDVQINAVISLSKLLIEKHNIAPINVVGHSDIAPARKQDPGEKFPWAGLAAAGVGLWPEGIEADRRVLFEAGSRDRGVAIAQRGLAHIGYDARVSGVLDTDTQLIITALQRRYRPDHIDGQIDIETMDMIRWLSERAGSKNV